MKNEYVLSFSSFYKAAYAQDMLGEAQINSTLKKLPTELIRSCSTGLYLRQENMQPVLKVLENKQIKPIGVYQIMRDEEGMKSYKKMR